MVVNLRSSFQTLEIKEQFLDEKKQQTAKKVQYVSEYITQWAHISTARKEVTHITFIDCMCNAGVYKDGDLCTSMCVLQTFIELARRYPQKKYRLMLNDNDKNRVKIIKKVITSIRAKKYDNLEIFIMNMDVNDYLEYLSKNHMYDSSSIFGYGYATVVYVDPYNFGTVQIPKVTKLLSQNYCELIFNFFISDFRRNIAKDSGRLQFCLGGTCTTSEDELMEYMRSSLTVGSIKYLFAYTFRTKKNVDLYQIVFATPSIRGLEVLKDVLWKVFDGKEYHRNFEEDENQIGFFTTNDETNWRKENYAREAQLFVTQYAPKQTEISFKEIESNVIQRTMLKESDVLSCVVKPLLQQGAMRKCGRVRKSNYKDDCYIISTEID